MARKCDRFCAKVARWSCTAEEELVEQDRPSRKPASKGRQIEPCPCQVLAAVRGTIASRLLIELGVADPKEALRRVRRARPGAVETWDQDNPSTP